MRETNVTNSISKQLLGALALLCSSSGFAAGVTAVPSNASPNVGDSFYVDVFGSDFPETGGATLKLFFNSNVAVLTPTQINGIVLAPGSPFTEGVVYNDPDPFLSGNIFSVLGPLVGQLPSGNFGGNAAFRISFTALAPGAADVVLFDDGDNFSWSDTNALAIPVTYTQAHVNVVPVPTAVWLFGSALGLMGAMRRKAAIWLLGSPSK